MIKVYLDKNVLSHILTNQRGGSEAHGVTESDLKDLLEAVAVGKLVCLLGVMHLQEAAYALRAKSPQVAKEELKLIRELMYTKKIIKFPGDLLKDDILSYSQGAGPTSPMMANSVDLGSLFSDSGDIEKRKKALDETTEHNAGFLDKTTNANANDRAPILAEFSGNQPSFEEFYDKKILGRISKLVDRAEREIGQKGLKDACNKRGLEGLLEFKSVAMAEGASLSYQYARVFNEMSEKRGARKGDASDLNHALLASAADILVTHDGDFAFWVGRIPKTKIEVVDHVHKLVAHIKQ
jgi:hypothetical protein